MLTVDTQEECISKLKVWKAGMESEGLHVNMRKTKFLVSGDGHDVLKKSVKYPCALSCSGVEQLHPVLTVYAVGPQEVQ